MAEAVTAMGVHTQPGITDPLARIGGVSFSFIFLIFSLNIVTELLIELPKIYSNYLHFF